MVELILLSRLGGPDFALNPDLIERAEETPDTVVTLVGGNKYVIRESLEELMELINHNRAQVIANAELLRAELGRGAESAARHPAAPRPPEHKRENPTELHSVTPLHPREA
jgi:flagellar protein FlbD